MESDIMDQAKQIQKLIDELTLKYTTIENLNADNQRLADRAKKDAECIDKVTNELEQYGGRNNIRIAGIKGDTNRQSSKSTTEQFIKTIKDMCDMFSSIV